MEGESPRAVEARGIETAADRMLSTCTCTFTGVLTSKGTRTLIWVGVMAVISPKRQLNKTFVLPRVRGMALFTGELTWRAVAPKFERKRETSSPGAMDPP